MLATVWPGGTVKYATTKPIVPMIETVNSTTTWRSARLFAAGSRSERRSWCSGWPGFSNRSGSGLAVRRTTPFVASWTGSGWVLMRTSLRSTQPR